MTDKDKQPAFVKRQGSASIKEESGSDSDDDRDGEPRKLDLATDGVNTFGSEDGYPRYQWDPGNPSTFGSAPRTFGSVQTDFDDQLCPGALAEHDPTYMQQIYAAEPLPPTAPDASVPSSSTKAPPGNFSRPPGTFARPPGDFSSGASSGPPPGMPMPARPPGNLTAANATNAGGYEAKAAELDAVAQQLMNAAMQYKQAALDAQDGGVPPAIPAGMPGMAAVPAMPVMPVMPVMGDPYMAMGFGFPAGAWPMGAAGWVPATGSNASGQSEKTTIMLRNLPNDYTRDMVLELLDRNGFLRCYDFVYLPVDFKRKAGLGYAFVNMVTHQEADRAFRELQGFCAWRFTSSKKLEVAWGVPLQGLQVHIDRYRNSPVMHEDVPDKFRPLLFRNGVRIPFPPPTKKLKPPRMKAGREPGADDDGEDVPDA